MQENTVFAVLNALNCNEHTEKKGSLTYLSWAWAWQMVKTHYPDASYTIYENPDGWNYFTDGRTCWVKTGVTICGLEHIEYLPVMDARNQSIPFDSVRMLPDPQAGSRNFRDASLSWNWRALSFRVFLTVIALMSASSAFRSSRNSGSMTLWMFSRLV